MDDVGASTKIHEIYGKTRLPVGKWQIPFPGNFLFIKYLPSIRKWGPYNEMTVSQWESFLDLLETYHCKLTLGITASWVEYDGTLLPFHQKFPDQAQLLKKALSRGLIEIANHGLTHCVLAGRQFRPRLFSSNRKAHREFWDWIHLEEQEDHLERSQAILQDYFQTPVVTFVPPGNVFQPSTAQLARQHGLINLSCNTATRIENGTAYVGDDQLLAFHDREIVLEGREWLGRRLNTIDTSKLLFVREIGESMRQHQKEPTLG